MPGSGYWRKRFKQLEQLQNKAGLKCYSDIGEQFREAQKQLETQIHSWYSRFAANNGITMQEARRMLTAAELDELKWDINQYIKHGQENAVNGKWIKELENASARYHISRLEALKIHTQQCIETLFGNQLDTIDKAVKGIYRSGYYHTAFEIQKGFGVGWDFAALDERQVEKIINKPWASDDGNFSSRIWRNKTKLVNELESTLSRNIILGQDPQKAIDVIAKKMQASKAAAGRLVMTEGAFFSSAAQKDCFGLLDIEWYEIVATLDSHTSDICQHMDGKKFKMTEWETGTTAPPFHVYCRSTTVPYFDDSPGSDGERVARGKDGRTYYVPADMTYKEWRKSFVKSNNPVLIQVPQINDEKIRNANEKFRQILLNNKSSPYNDKMILYNSATEYQLDSKLMVPFAYNPQKDIIQYNPSAPCYELYDMDFVQAHELSHRMDILEYHSWKNKNFLQAVEYSRKKIYNNTRQITGWFSESGKYENDMALSDILSALSAGRLNDVLYGGHQAEYWEDNINVCLEIFANISSIDILGYSSKKEFNGILKELYAAYKEITL